MANPKHTIDKVQLAGIVDDILSTAKSLESHVRQGTLTMNIGRKKEHISKQDISKEKNARADFLRLVEVEKKMLDELYVTVVGKKPAAQKK